MIAENYALLFLAAGGYLLLSVAFAVWDVWWRRRPVGRAGWSVACRRVAAGLLVGAVVGAAWMGVNHLFDYALSGNSLARDADAYLNHLILAVFVGLMAQGAFVVLVFPLTESELG